LTIDPTRADTWRVHLWVESINDPSPKLTDRVLDFGIWDKKSGGSLDSEERIYYPGSMVPSISLGGRTTPEAVTLQKIFDLNFDPLYLETLFVGVGKAWAHVAQMPMNIQGMQTDHHINYIGTLKTVTVPDHDSEGNDPAMIEVVISVANAPTVKVKKGSKYSVAPEIFNLTA
jgi:hypothetical protein